ncbi:MAG: SurA N-terminal domain-containing protein, partial [bacterium]|nr:SurA N-terminal domain-containing protein [bacterium]
MNEEEQDQTISSIPRRRRSAVLVIVAIFAIMSFFVYQAPFGGTLVSRIASVVPYPLIKVNATWISYDYALQRRDGLKSYYETQSIEMNDQIDFQQKLLQSLVHERLIRQLMKDYQVYLGDGAVMDLMNDLEEQSGSRGELVSDIFNVYGWNLKKFEKHVAKPFVEAQALESAILQDPELQKAKRDLIEEAS